MKKILRTKEDVMRNWGMEWETESYESYASEGNDEDTEDNSLVNRFKKSYLSQVLELPTTLKMHVELLLDEDCTYTERCQHSL